MATENAFKSTHDQIAILDFGSQYSHIIARRIRELNIYCELHSCLVDVSVLEAAPLKGIILSGGPFSVYEKDAPHMQKAIWTMAEKRGLPILGICYGFQEMVHHFGGKVDKAPHREYGHATVQVIKSGSNTTDTTANDLLQGLGDEFTVWMSHGDKIHEIPEGFEKIGITSNSEFAAVASITKEKSSELCKFPNNRLFGVQFHPEVSHTPKGLQLLRNFAVNICNCSQNWSMEHFLTESIENIRRTVGDKHVIGAVSGGVDSTVAAVLLAKAIGDRFHAVMVDNGLLRKDERIQVLKRLRDELGVNLRAVDASEQFLSKLAGVTDPEKKRKIIGAEFIHVFEAEAASIGSKVDFLLQGTLYPDVIESISFKGPSATIKSHHNVGGLLADMKLRLIEPLRELFKDEVRALGVQLGLPLDVINRHPFPGPGLAIRVLGEVTRSSCDILREADAIFLEEIRASGDYDKIGQAFAVLLPCKSVGVMGDGRTYEQVVALRAVATSDYMTADWYRMPYDVLAKVSTRIINEVRGVNRVVYDVSSKPPATIEWE